MTSRGELGGQAESPDPADDAPPSAVAGSGPTRPPTELAARLRDAEEALAAERARSAAFVRTMAGLIHELNNPLASVCGHVQLLAHGEGGYDERRALELVCGEAERAAAIAHRLADAIRAADRLDHSPGTQHGEPADPPGAGSGRRIEDGAVRALDVLVVDDEAAIRAIVTRHLGSRGHAVVSAGRGEEALRLAAQGEFDVVVCDLRLPETDGLELLRRLRATSWGPAARFIVSTGARDDAASAPELGGVAVLEKPYDLETLRIAVEE